MSNQRIAVLCPGPSLPRFWGEQKKLGWDAVVAVNRAGWIYDCDWLVYADRPIGDAIRSGDADPPRVGYVTHPRTVLPSPAARARMPLRQTKCRYGELLPRGEDVLTCCYTFPHALAIAWGLAADGEVHVYGFDCSSSRDVVLGDGHHGADRWRSELPWVKHAWPARAQVHSDLPGSVRAWLGAPGEARELWERVCAELEAREGKETLCVSQC